MKKKSYLCIVKHLEVEAHHKQQKKVMKKLPKKIEKTLTNELGDITLTRIITEELIIGTIRYYLCGCYNKGYFAAWNEKYYFNESDIKKFDSINKAWDYLNEEMTK